MTHTLLSSPRGPGTWQDKLLNEPGQPERQCVVIRVETEDEVGHASAVLLDTKPGCFQGLGTWVLSRLAIQGYGPSIQGFWPFELAISRG